MRSPLTEAHEKQNPRGLDSVGMGRQFLALVVGLQLFLGPALAQQPAQSPQLPPSDLALQNLSRVAASAAQIRAVLVKETGLLLELKRWVAKEATDRGQIVEEADLADNAILDRLAEDVEFRAVATRLLQRYGYLIPTVNPESEAAKEQDLVRQERAQRLARARARADAAEEDPIPELPAQTTRGQAPSRGRASAAEPRAEREGEAPIRRQFRDENLSLAGGTASSGEFAPRRDATTSAANRNPMEDPTVPARLLLPTGVQTERFPTVAPEQVEAIRARVDSLGNGNGNGQGNTDSEPTARRSTTALPRDRAKSSVPEAFVPPEEASLVRRPNPFADVPSLYEMYRQVSPKPQATTRFGEEVFRNSSLDPENLPMDLPVGPDYMVGPGDGLAIDMWGSVSQRMLRTVDTEGRLSLPEVGPILVSGRTLGELQATVQQILRTQFRDVSADVSLSRLRTIRVYVVGDAANPGAYDISSLSTPLNALFVAGGPTDRGSLRTLRHYRGDKLVQEVDVYDLLLRGVRANLKQLRSGDTVLVPPIGPRITVEGAVRRPAIYELKSEKTLAEALALAGGILPTAALRQVQVERLEAHEKRTMLSLDLAESTDPAAIAKALSEFEIRNGDEVHIFSIAPYNQNAVYLQGHVVRPGRYSYRAGMKITDLVASYADLLPEPAARYAEIIRLTPPDFRPAVESVDLGAAFANPASAPELKPLDTVRIFSRYDFENIPTVQVGGEVRNPGVYQTSGQLHIRDAVHLAGGVTPDALLDTAQVFRFQSDSKMKIMSVNLKEALAGNPIENILLTSRDRLLIHRNPARVDPPSVYVKGEVAKPGRYPQTTNMRVSDLIRVGGGMKRSAYTEQADLTRYLSENRDQLSGEHQEINIAAALAGDPAHDLVLRDGDTLAIRQLPGWKDIGAAVTLEGEVEHPGTYGIQPGEKLSAVLRRAGGFRQTAYPAGAVLEREEVRRMNEKNREDLIRRVQDEIEKIEKTLDSTPPEQKGIQQAALLQRQRVLQRLRESPTSGRLVIRVTSVDRLARSADDIELRDGDRLRVPKRPGYVLIVGQVYNPNAITFVPRKNAAWYLQRAGGATKLAEEKDVFIIRANGEVVTTGGGWWNGGLLSTSIEPGDTIVVPEKPIGESQFWRNALTIAQIASSIGVTAAVAFR